MDARARQAEMAKAVGLVSRGERTGTVWSEGEWGGVILIVEILAEMECQAASNSTRPNASATVVSGSCCPGWLIQNMSASGGGAAAGSAASSAGNTAGTGACNLLNASVQVFNAEGK